MTDKKFGTARFVEREDGFWDHFDADSRRIGEPHRDVFVYEEPLVAEVKDRWGSKRLIDVRGRNIGKAFLHESERKFKDGPGDLQWIDDERQYVAVSSDGSVVCAVDEMSPQVYKDVRWVRKGDAWLLIGPDGKPTDLSTSV